jgi:heterotetrameric sarcosine oxidase delta subunit
MLIIECPYCGPRDQSEFSNGGEAHVKRPDGSQDISDREWAEYVFIRSNPKGLFYERWVHSHGCRKWFNCVRDTSTDEILKTYKIDEPRPDLKRFKNNIITPSGEPKLGSGNFTVKK